MGLPVASPSIFDQYNVGERRCRECRAIVKTRYPGYNVDDGIDQGGCSYTVKLTRRSERRRGKLHRVLVVQFRPSRFAISLDIATAPKQWYGDLAPSVREICRRPLDEEEHDVNGLVAYEMSFLPGRRLDELLPSTHLDDGTIAKYHSLLNDLVAFHAQAWTKGSQLRKAGQGRHCNGKVGATMLDRLDKLAQHLPSPALRSIAGRARQQVVGGVLDSLPSVLTHGDLLPSNILVDPSTWHITGLVDWAESEYLPFGMSLYGLEHLLGHTSSRTSGTAAEYEFMYRPEASSLRDYFWQQLIGRVPQLNDGRTREAVEVARVVGTLLWHGFAWDEGRIDRTVEVSRDGREVAFLEAFLDVKDACSKARL